MFTLHGQDLVVELLDPVADAGREGARYCAGGYIWQVRDAVAGDLLSGPCYPDEPAPFFGQGAPDMFLGFLGEEGASAGDEVGRVGVGRVRYAGPGADFRSLYDTGVINFLAWEVAADERGVVMRAEDDFRDRAYGIERSVRLEGRILHSRTAVRNLGGRDFPLCWYAHPFFPVPADDRLCRFSPPVALAPNPGFALDADGQLVRQAGYDWRGGCYQPLALERSGLPLTVLQRHPKVGQVETRTDFPPSYLPVWGNDRTFSFEPHHETRLGRGQAAAWSISYRFPVRDGG